MYIYMYIYIHIYLDRVYTFNLFIYLKFIWLML